MSVEALRVVEYGLGERLVPYTEAWDEQRRLQTAVADGTEPDTLLLLEHEPVYTAGRRTEPWERPIDGTPVVDVDRGGKITWHGPGQLVGYPIVRLPAPYDVVGHVRRLEVGLIAACAELGLRTTQVAGRSGVWVTADDRGPDRKVAAIGIRVARGVTMHGFALNADCDLTSFGRDRALRHHRRRGDVADRRAGPARDRARHGRRRTPARRRCPLPRTSRSSPP